MTGTRTPTSEVWMELASRKKLAKLMAIQEVSQRELSAAAGWESHSYLGRLLRGEVKTLKPEAAARIALHLGVGVDDLFFTKISNPIGQSRHSKKTKKVSA